MTHIRAVATDDPLEQVFRCWKYTCDLSHRACLDRQVEKKRIPTAKEPIPMFPYCASRQEQGKGEECIQGKAVRQEHPTYLGGSEPKRTEPRLDIVQAVEARITKERSMPKGVRPEPWPCCGSKSFRHLQSCEQAGKKAREGLIVVPVKRRKGVPALERPRAPRVDDLEAYSIGELVELRKRITAEVERRLMDLHGQIKALESFGKGRGR